MSHENVSPDLIWNIVRGNNSYLTKRRNPNVQFSRDPLNLMNKHSRKYDGFADRKAIGVQPGPERGVVLLTKTTKSPNKPAKLVNQTNFSSSTSRKTYRGIVSSTAKRGYRSDLRAEAVARASAVRNSQRKKKDYPPKKPRSKKEKEAAAKAT
ncbi:MAG: hypothetical protein M1831_002896 [Alyxoria varia]|nr:MAG: hypothetical protein M1831_002896 [Alyxoria varia]